MALDGYGINNAGYAQQASDLQYRYNTDRASNAYGRFLSQQRGSRQLGELNQEMRRGLPNVYSNFTNRGFAGPGVRSGVAGRAMRNYLGDYTTAYQRAQSDATQEAQNYDLQAAQLDAYYNNSLAALEQQKQQDIANAALALESLRGLLGGI